MWDGILCGRVALVDALDWEGKRLFVVRENDGPASGRALTVREREVPGFVLAGRANKVIAWELGIAASTVSLRIRSMFGKLGCSDRAALLELGEILRG